MGNLIPSNNNDDNIDFNPTKLPGCKVWIDATDESSLFTTDYQGSVTVPDDFVPTSISGCATWYDSSDSATLYNTSAGPVTPIASPTDISGCSLWLDASDTSTLYTTDAGPVTAVNAPTDIAGCVLWLDGDDASTVTTSGGNVSQWSDKSGGGRHFTATGTEQPAYSAMLNGRSVITFNGSTNTLTGNSAAQDIIRNRAGYTFFAVSRVGSVNAGERLICGFGSLVIFRAGQNGSSPYAGGRRLAGDVLENITGATGSLTSGSSYITSAVINHTTQSIIGNLNGAGFASDTTYMGAGNSEDSALLASVGSQSSSYGFYNGDIAEIIIFDSALSINNRARVEAYLSAKWGISGVHTQSTSSGDPIGYWQDKSGNNNHAIASGGTERPITGVRSIGGKNAINFNGDTHIMRADGLASVMNGTNKPTTVFVVVDRDTPKTNSALAAWFNTQTNIPLLHLRFDGAYWVIAKRDNTFPPVVDVTAKTTSSTTPAGTDALVYSTVITGSTSVIYENGSTNLPASDISVGLTTINAFVIGGASSSLPASFFAGAFAEVIVYSTALSAVDRSRVEKYLANKWGISDPHIPTPPNGPIGCWLDKSGNNRHATQNIGSYRPSYSGAVNNLPAITFDGTDDHFLIGDLSSAFPNFGEVFIVFEPNNAATYELYQTSNNYPIYRYSTAGTSQFGAFTSSRTTATAFGIPTSGVHITTMRADSSSMTVRFDGSVLWTQSGLGYNGGNYHAIGYSNQGTGIGVGGTVMNGKIVEVITYNTDIGAENRAKVEQYLAKKWGIDRNLHKPSKKLNDKIGYVKNKGIESTYLYQLNHDNRPKIGTLSNRKAIDFTQSSVNSYLQSPILNTNNHEFSFFIAYSHNNTNSTLFTLGVQDQFRLISKYAGNNITYGGSNTLFYGNTPYPLSVPKIESIIKTVGGTSSSFTKLYVNGQLATPSASLGLASDMASSYGWLVLSGYSSPYTFLGHNNFIIGEFIYYNRTLSDQERQLVENYLYAKWDIDNLTYGISKPTDISNCILWLDANDPKTLFVDREATTNVLNDGQSVAYWADKVGGQDVAQSTASARPTYKTNIFNKDKPALYFDGGDDLLSIANRQTSSPCTMIVVCRIDLHNGDLSGIMCYGDTTGGNSGPGIIYQSAYRPFLDGAGAGGTNSSGAIQSILGKPSIITGIYTQNRTTNSYMYINGVFQQYYTGTGVALASSSPRIQIGSRTGGGFNSRRMTGYIAECIVYNKVLTDAERAAVENYLSEKWGIGSESRPSAIGSQIKLHSIKVSNKEAQNWVDRVFQNGGTVSQRTADSVNEFCKKIEDAGIRKKFYRLNLFCGNDLTACLTPLYLGPDSNTFYGNKTENNTGFIGSNYNEISGLTCDSHTKALLTGVSFADIGCSNTGHMSFYQTQYNINTNPVVNNGYVMGAGISSANDKYFMNLSTDSVITCYGDGSQENRAYYLGGLYLVNRSLNTDLSAYEQGNSIAQNINASSIGGAGSSTIIIFNTSTTGSSFNNAAFAHLGALKGYSFGQSMSASEVSSYNSIMESFQQSLGRGLSTRSAAAFSSVTNEDAKSWIDAVYANGGTVSNSTALAVNNFCNSIDSAGLRSKFYRLNLFCGANLNSCLVPLYKGPGKYSSRYGNTKDTNVSQDGYGYYANSDNFNYVENQGLLGNTQEIAGNSSVSRRYLNTGFIFGNVGALNNNLHYAVYSKDLTNGGYALGAYDGANTGFSLQIGLTGYNIGAFANSLLNLTNTSTARIFPTRKGLYVGNYSNYVLNLYEGRANIVGQRDLTTVSALTPATTSPVGIFGENRATVGISLFNYLERMQGYSIGSSLTTTDVQNYYDIMQTFQAALSRAQQTTLSSTFDSITNTDARDWLTRVYENGGTVSLTTATAVQNFCNTIDSAGLRGKFFRLNLFCGDNLNAATVPLYRGPSLNGMQHGFLIDINTNFTNSDYNETGSLAGIKGNGSNKRLDTGLGTDFTNNSSFSIGAFITEPTSVEFSNYLGAMQTTNNNCTQLYYRDRFTRGLDGVTFFPPAPNDGVITGYHAYSRTGALTQFHVNNSLIGTSNSATAASRGSYSIQVHALNNAGTMAEYGNGRISMYHIGLGLTSSEAATFYNAISTFNTSMGRTRPSDSFTSLTNDDAKIWVDNVYYNGGSVSTSTANLVNTFCNSIDSAGLRSKFYRVNLFCGNNLNASLVPVYRGPNKTLVYGAVKADTNNSFTNSDYVESGAAGGLTSDGTKYLEIGPANAFVPDTQSYHASIDIAGAFPDSTQRYIYGVFWNESPTSPRGWYAFYGSNTSSRATFAGMQSRSFSENVDSLKITSRVSNTDMRIYENGSQVGTTQTTLDTSTQVPGSNFNIMAAGYQNISNGVPGTVVNGYARSVGRLMGYSVGTGLTSSDVAAFYSAYAAFKTALGRNA